MYILYMYLLMAASIALLRPDVTVLNQPLQSFTFSWPWIFSFFWSRQWSQVHGAAVGETRDGSFTIFCCLTAPSVFFLSISLNNVGEILERYFWHSSLQESLLSTPYSLRNIQEYVYHFRREEWISLTRVQ